MILKFADNKVQLELTPVNGGKGIQYLSHIVVIEFKIYSPIKLRDNSCFNEVSLVVFGLISADLQQALQWLFQTTVKS